MKKFLGKKPVWICFIVAAVIFLAVEIGILVRPLSYGLNYTYKEEIGGVKVESTIKVHSDSVARMTMKEGDDKIVMDMWIYRDGHNVLTLEPKKIIEYAGMTSEQIDTMNESCMTKAEYKEVVKELEDLKKDDKDAYNAMMEDAMHFGIFQAGEGDEIAKCPQAIAFVVVHGVFTVALITFAALSTVVVIKKKKA